MKAAPLILFAFNRPSHLRLTLQALQQNVRASETPVIFFVDGPKSTADHQLVQEVRNICSSADGFASVETHFSDVNLGLANSIIRGVTSVLIRYERIIVLEDDMVVSPYFLSYMNSGLELYAEEHKVASIHGYVEPVQKALPESFFLRGADCWGWATWKRAWSKMNPNGSELLESISGQGLIRQFDLDGSYPYFQMLKDQVAGKNQSWAIRWYASCFLEGMFTLYPGKALVENIGFDGSGSHCPSIAKRTPKAYPMALALKKIPVLENMEARKAIAAYHRKQSSRLVRLVRRIRTRLQNEAFFPSTVGIAVNPFYLIRSHLADAIKDASRNLKNCRTLDFGCGSKPYESLFQASSYVGVDIHNEGHEHHNELINVFYDGRNLPFADASFDLIFASEVLEHVSDLNQILVEFKRILAPGGSLLITVPFVWPEHEAPNDHARYSMFGMTKELENHGFAVNHSLRCGNAIETILQLCIVQIQFKLGLRGPFWLQSLKAMLTSPLTLIGILSRLGKQSPSALYLNSVILAQSKVQK